MPLDVGRVTHLLEQMHRSEDDAGDPIVVDKVLVTDGARGFTWEDYAATADAILRYGGAAEWYFDHGGVAVGAAETIDLADGNAHSIILDVNCTLTFTGAVASIDGQDVASSFVLKVIQDGTGGNTITWPGSVVWPDGVTPTLDTTGDSVEFLTFWTDDGGTTWYGFHGGGSGATALDDLTDVTITAVAEDDMLQWNGSVWVNSGKRWEAVTDGEDVFVWESDDLVHEWKEY